jgi:hypothetical protein
MVSANRRETVHQLEIGHGIGGKSDAMLRQLVDLAPSDPDTVRNRETRRRDAEPH